MKNTGLRYLLWFTCLMCSALVSRAGVAMTYFSIEDISIQYASENGSIPIHLGISYSRELKALNQAAAGFDWADASTFGSTNHFLLFLFVQNAGLQYLEGKELPRGVVITCREGDEVLRSARREHRKWFFSTKNAEYCKQTLALREDGKVVELLPNADSKSGEWLKLTRVNYETWWEAIDQKLHLSDIFVIK